MQGSESDETLVKGARSGNRNDEEKLLRRYKNMVLARARGFFLAGGETDDLVQEGMIGLCSAINEYSENAGKSFKNFAYLCVSRQILDAVKRSIRLKNSPLNNSVSLFDPYLEQLEGEVDPEAFLLDDESRSEFRSKLMRTLSDFEFRVMTMYLEGMSYTDICEATGKDIKSVDNALARSKKKLRQSFSK